MSSRQILLVAIAATLLTGTAAEYNASSFPKPGSMYSVAQCAANAGICLPGQWPVTNRIAPVIPEWVASIDLLGLPTATKRPSSQQFGVSCDPTLTDYYGVNGVCDFTCVGCTRSMNGSVGGEYNLCPGKRDWALTYDDGASNNTVPILDNLKALGIKATFFVIGSRVLQRPDVLLRAYNEGHQICLHTWAHAAVTAMSNDQIITDTYWTAKAVYQVLGQIPTCVRTPYGDNDDRTRWVYKAMGLRMVGWNRDTFDWKVSDPLLQYNATWIIGNVTQWVSQVANLTTGIISLEHDLDVQSQKGLSGHISSDQSTLKDVRQRIQSKLACKQDKEAMATKVGTSVSSRSSTLQRLSNTKTIGLVGGITLLVNGMTGTGIPFIAPLFQQAGWVIPILLFIFFAIVATFCSLFIVEAMQAIPGNRYFQGTVEFGTLINFYFGQTEHIIGQIFLYGALQSSAIQAIILSAQTMDNVLIDIFHRSCGLSLGPNSGWSCVSELANGSPFGNEWMLFTGGILLVAILCVPMGMVDLDSNVWLQIVSFAVTLLVFLQWLIAGTLAGIHQGYVPVVGAGFESVVGVIMLNFAFTTIVPSWINIKLKDVNTQATLWYSVGISLVIYMIVGIIPGMAFNIPVGSNLLPALNVQGVPQALSKATTYIFSIVALITSIPVFFIVARDNLVQNRILGRRAATFVAYVIPWIVALPFQSGNALSFFVNWSSLIFTSVANFVIPLMIYLRCLKFRRAYNENRALTSHQKQLLKAIHYASNTINKGIDDGSIDPDYNQSLGSSNLPTTTPDTSLPFRFVVVDENVTEKVDNPSNTIQCQLHMNPSQICSDSGGSEKASSLGSPTASFTMLSSAEDLTVLPREQLGIVTQPTMSINRKVFNSLEAQSTPSRTVMRGLQTIMRPSAAQRDEPFVSARQDKLGDEALNGILALDVPDPDAEQAVRNELRRGFTGRLLSLAPPSPSLLTATRRSESKLRFGTRTMERSPSKRRLLGPTCLGTTDSLSSITDVPDLARVTNVSESHAEPVPEDDEEHRMRSRRSTSFRRPQYFRGDAVELSNVESSETRIQGTNTTISTSNSSARNSSSNNTLSNGSSDNTVGGDGDLSSYSGPDSHSSSPVIVARQPSQVSMQLSARKIQFSSGEVDTSNPVIQAFSELRLRKITQLTEPSFVSSTTFRALPEWFPVRGAYVAGGFLTVTTLVTVANLVLGIVSAMLDSQ
ncbi:hypothetical protein SeLEV6574_g03238 [Synchytrium endobioticum]|nr:hypothetical protein SeLEV6574_g03238 [Synchytrium endobioticum]